MKTHLIVHNDDKQFYDHFLNWAKFLLYVTVGEAYSRTKQWGLALKKFYAIQKHFQDYIYDMSDFHGFCLRKVKINSHGNSTI